MNRFTLKETGIRDVVTGNDVVIMQPSNLYECILGDHCFVGPFTEIQKGVVVGNNCRIQSHTFICELVNVW